MLDVLAVHFAVFHHRRTKRHSAETFQDCITAMIRMVMFVLLLLCGDIESNPGPNEHQPMVFRSWSCHPRRCCCCYTRRRPTEFESHSSVASCEVVVINVNDGQAQQFCERDQQRVPACPSTPPSTVQDMDTRQKKVHEIERMDTNKKIDICSSTLDRLWCEVCSQWDDVTTGDFKLTEADGTELVDDVYYQQLATEIPLQLRLKTKGKKSRSKSNARANAKPLTDDVIHEIATDHINHDIVKLGLAMGLTQQRISKYKAENATEPRAESRGTENMIMYWRQRCDDADQVGAFCNVLRQAELNELADDLSNGLGLHTEVSPTQPTKSQTSMTSASSAIIGDGNLRNMASSTSQLGACSSDTARISRASSSASMGDGNIQSMAFSTSELGACSSDTARISQTSSSASMGDANLQSMASSTSQLSACSSDTERISQASFKVDTSPDRYVTQDKVLDLTYPIALVTLSSANQPEKLKDDLQQRLPGKVFMLIDIENLTHNWHLFEAILLDFGALQEAAFNSSAEYMGALDIYRKCLKMTLVPQNVAVLMLAPANTPMDHKRASDIIRMISEISKTTEVSVFQYGSESCRPTLFDDKTKNRLVFWLLDCYKRYNAAVLGERPNLYKNYYTSFKYLFR